MTKLRSTKICNLKCLLIQTLYWTRTDGIKICDLDSQVCYSSVFWSPPPTHTIFICIGTRSYVKFTKIEDDWRGEEQSGNWVKLLFLRYSTVLDRCIGHHGIMIVGLFWCRPCIKISFCRYTRPRWSSRSSRKFWGNCIHTVCIWIYIVFLGISRKSPDTLPSLPPTTTSYPYTPPPHTLHPTPIQCM